jgi:hypothetical protein
MVQLSGDSSVHSQASFSLVWRNPHHWATRTGAGHTLQSARANVAESKVDAIAMMIWQI